MDGRLRPKLHKNQILLEHKLQISNVNLPKMFDKKIEQNFIVTKFLGLL